MRIMQGGILVALVVIAGFLYEIRKQMTQAPGPAVESQQVAPAPQLAQPVVTPAVAPPPARPAPQRATVRRATPALAPAPAPEPVYEAEAAPVYTPPPAPVEPAPPPAHVLTVREGTVLTIRLIDGVSTERNRPGDTFQATLEEPLVADGILVADRGANVFGRVVHTQQSGRVSGLAEMALELDRLQTVGGEVRIASDTKIERAESTKGKDAVKAGVMTGIGAAIGGIAGGRKGAGIGAAAGGAAGAGTVLATRGKPVEFPPESRLTFRLRAPISVTVDAGGARTAGYEEGPRLRRRY